MQKKTMQVMINYFPYPWPLTNKLRLAFHRAVLLKFAATSSNVLGSSVGVTKVTKNAMWPTVCLACLFVYVTSNLTFPVSGNRFFGIVIVVEILSVSIIEICIDIIMENILDDVIVKKGC
jgi:hypothetical protein